MDRRSSKLGRAGMGMLGALALGAALAALVPGCGADGPADPCETVYADQCGTECITDDACPSGLHCGAGGTCTADCTPDGYECGFDVTCSANGRCGGDPGNGFGSGPGSNPNGSCPSVNVTFDEVTPTVMLLIDQSGSMTDDFGGDGTRWDVLYDALMDQQSGVVARLGDEIRFGLALYTSRDGTAGGACPLITQVNASLGNYEAIRDMYQAANPDDETPTGESITKTVEYLKTIQEPGPKMILLATDGMPDTCAEPNPQNGEEESLAAAKQAFDQGIKTVVLSVGPEVALDHLQDMANAGAGVQQGNAPYYQALDQASLIDAFEQIIGGVRACVFTLNGEVTTTDPSQGTVVLDGEPLTYNDPDGWRLNNPSEIEVVGEACQRMQEGTHTLSVTFPCGTVTVDVE